MVLALAAEIRLCSLCFLESKRRASLSCLNYCCVCTCECLTSLKGFLFCHGLVVYLHILLLAVFLLPKTIVLYPAKKARINCTGAMFPLYISTVYSSSHYLSENLFRKGFYCLIPVSPGCWILFIAFTTNKRNKGVPCFSTFAFLCFTIQFC